VPIRASRQTEGQYSNVQAVGRAWVTGHRKPHRRSVKETLSQSTAMLAGFRRRGFDVDLVTSDVAVMRRSPSCDRYANQTECHRTTLVENAGRGYLVRETAHLLERMRGQ